MPGVAMKTIWPCFSGRIPSTRSRVVCALGVTIETFIPRIEFRSVDFPAFGRPTMAIKPALDMSTYCLDGGARGVLLGFFFGTSHGACEPLPVHAYFDF